MFRKCTCLCFKSIFMHLFQQNSDVSRLQLWYWSVVFYLVASLSAHISDQQVLRREPRQGPDKAAHSVRAHLVEANQRSSLRFMKELHQGSQTTTLTAGGIQDDPELTLCFSLERHNGNKDKSKPQSEVMWRHSSSWSHLDLSYSAHDTV